MGIPTIGLAGIADLVGGVTPIAAFDYLACGETATAYAITQTALAAEITGNGVERAQDATPTRSTTTVTNDTLGLNYTWTASGSETVREVASFNAAAAGSMLHREVLGTARALTSGSTYSYTLSVVFS